MLSYKKAIIFFLLSLFCYGQTAFDRSAPSVPWFDHVKKPLPFPAERMELFCKELRQAILAGNSIDEIEALAPKDSSPRVIFISLGDGVWPERTYFGAGFSFSAALRQVLAIMIWREEQYAEIISNRIKKDIAELQGRTVPDTWQKKLKNPAYWSTLRLDIVQAALPVEGFTVKNSRLLLSSLNGLAFNPDLSFTFTAEQMMGRYLLTRQRKLNDRQIAEFISESDNWDALKVWMELANSHRGERVCLFEYDSYFADAEFSTRLFRGRQSKFNYELKDSMKIALQVAELLAGNLQKDASLASFFPEWVPGRGDGDESFSSLAELAITFARLSKLEKQDNFSQYSKLIIDQLLSKCQSSRQKNYRFLVEKEDLPEGEMILDARDFVNLHSNALLCLAIIESGLAASDKKYLQDCQDILAYITRQQRRDGSFVLSLVLPDMQPPLESNFNYDGAIESAALAALAIYKYAELDDKNAKVLQKRYELAVRNLQQKFAEEQNIEELPLSPWLIELLCLKTEATKEEKLLFVKFALAASLKSDKKPLFPDLFGSTKNLPSMTVAAEQTWIIAKISKWLFEQGEKDNAKAFLADSWPIWIFQQQALMDKTSSAALPRPELYLNFFRDHLEDFGFDLNGQTTQILSILAINECLELASLTDYPKHPTDLQTWNDAWKLIDQRPFCLDPALVQKTYSEDDNRDSMGTLERGTTITIKTKGGKLIGTDPYVSGRTLEKQSRSGRRK